jgi:hypothetical protein
MKTELFRYGRQNIDTGIINVDSLDEEIDEMGDPFSDNVEIETEAELDGDSTNPFGDY